MKTFNIWKLEEKRRGPTGPWVFCQAVIATSESEAMNIARSRFGLDGTYKVYEGI